MSDFNPGPVVLRGRHITLTPVEPNHFDELWLQAKDTDIWTWMLNEPPTDRVSFQTWFDEMLQSHASRRSVAYTVMHEGRAVGSTRLFDFRPNDRGLEIGYTWYGPDARGTLVNPEAKLLLLTHSFEHLGCNRVQLKTDERNERSRRAMLRMGAKFEGILRRYQVREDGFCRNTAMFSVIREEWPEVKAALQARVGA